MNKSTFTALADPEYVEQLSEETFAYVNRFTTISSYLFVAYLIGFVAVIILSRKSKKKQKWIIAIGLVVAVIYLLV